MTQRGSIIWLAGRGRTGKSTFARVMHAYSLANSYTITMVDLDRNNATLVSFVRHAQRPDFADDVTSAAFLETRITEVIETGGNLLIDTGGGDRLVADLMERHELMGVLRAHQIGLTICHFAAGGQDDFEGLKKMTAMGLTPDRTILVLNAGLAGVNQAAEDPFYALLQGQTVTTCLTQGATVIRMPAVPLATMVAADSLFIGLDEAANGEIPKDENGFPEKGAVPLPFFRRLELKRWLNLMTDQFDKATVSKWLV